MEAILWSAGVRGSASGGQVKLSEKLIQDDRISHLYRMPVTKIQFTNTKFGFI